MIVALAGGVGGARLAVGLAAVLPPRKLAIVVNTGDDFEHLGLTICPDLDTVVYTLAGVHNPATGWGRADETWHAMQTLETLGGETWFRLGDRDLGMHLERTRALAAGEPLSSVTRRLALRLGVRHTVLPMSETPVRTRVATAAGEVDFQQWFVRLRCRPRVHGLRFAGARSAVVPAPLAAIMEAPRIDALVMCPSNPFVSIAPVLAVPAIRRWIARRRFPIVAVSPIVGGAAVKGPAGRLLRQHGLPCSAVGVARHYGDLVDGWVIDRADQAARPSIERMGRAVLVADTLVADPHRSASLARDLLSFAREVARAHAA